MAEKVTKKELKTMLAKVVALVEDSLRAGHAGELSSVIAEAKALVEKAED